MKIKNILPKSFILVLAAFMLIFTLTTNKAYGSTYMPPDGRFLIAYNESRLAPGINEAEVITNGADGKSQVTGYALEVDINLPTAGIIATYKDHNASVWGMQTVRQQAAAAERKTGLNIVAGVNADFYNMSTGQPIGALVMNGVQYNGASYEPFFAILKDGSAYIGENHEYAAMKDDIKEAVGGSIVMVKNGVLNVPSDLYYDQLNPRTAIGIKADGKVILYTADGRNYPQSVGLSLGDLAQMMKSLGAVTALNLDGGGSTTYVSKREGTGELTLRNVPSDGVERTVSSSLLVYSTAMYDGKFNHASISPTYGLYTPYTELDFNALGVDSAGGPANLPTDLEWRVDDPTFGTINEFGHFVSSGKEGTFTVSLYRNGVNVGSATNEIRIPDEVRFKNPEMSLGFEKVSDLGLQAFHQGRPITINDNDFDFEYDQAMGTFNGRWFTSSDSASLTGTIVAHYKYAPVSGELILTVGQLPVVIYDFEDPETVMSTWNVSTALRNEKGSIEVVDYSSGEPVRFGDKSLKLNFDFTEGLLGTTLGVYAGVATSVDIPGMPTHIGMWVYATPEAQGFWLRMRVYDVTGQIQQVDFSKEGLGIDWLGWKYVEGSLENYSGPFRTLDSQMIRLMMLRSGQPNSMGQMVAGTIYIDDIRVVYGANTDDLVQPIVESVRLNGEEVDGQTFTTNTFTLESYFTDDMTDKYATGMDYDKINVLIDGVNYRGNEHFYALDAGGNRVFLNDIVLPDGEHEIKLIIRDNFGNETEVTRYFNVDTKTANKVRLVPRTEKPILGQQFIVDVTADMVDSVDGLNLVLNSNTQPADVIFNENFEGTYTYNSILKTITIQGERINDTSESLNKVIASVIYNVPANANQNTQMGYSVKSGEITYRDQDPNPNYLSTFSIRPYLSNVVAGLNLSTGIVIHQVEGHYLVTDREGNPVDQAEVFLVTPSGDISLGLTDTDGLLSDEVIPSTIGQTQIYAVKGNEISFKVNVHTVLPFGESASPFNIKVNAAVDGSTAKNISWLTNPTLGTGNSILQMALKSDYNSRGVAVFKNYEGKNVIEQFTGAADVNQRYAVRINYAEALDLQAGKTYVYRVGDGQNWSDTREISTSINNSETNFFILGDVQTHNYQELANSLASINHSKRYDFGISTGDLVDELSKWDPFYQTSRVLAESWIGNVDMISALGNHEYMGDGDGRISGAYYNLPGHENGPVTHYSVRYGSVYIAVINFTQDRAGLINSLEWIVEDANNSDAAWKILVAHQPTYYTNIIGGNGLFYEVVPQYATLAGIDFVFSGHDHSYARTKPMINNVVNQDGTVYVISGSIGEKSYSAWNTPEFNFEIVLDNYDAVYMTVTATDTTFTYNLYETTGVLVDSYTKTKNVDKTGERFYIEGDRLISSVTGYSIPLASYTGFAYVEATGAKKYFIAGNAVKGWFSVSNKTYYAYNDGTIATENITIENADMYFDEDGVFKGGVTGFIEYQGKIRYYVNGEYLTSWQTIEGYVYYFSTADGTMRFGETIIHGETELFDSLGRLQKGRWVYSNSGIQYYFGLQVKGWYQLNDDWYYFSTANGVMRTGQTKISSKDYVFDSTGKLVIGAFVNELSGTRYYWGPNYVTGWQKIDGLLYYFDTLGYMVKGNQTINGISLEFNSDGVFVEKIDYPNGFIESYLGIRYYINNIYQTGWIDYQGHKYFADNQGYLVINRSLNIEGIVYAFDKEGKLINSNNITRLYTVYFVDYNGNPLSIQQIYPGESAFAPIPQTRLGYTFTGWDKSFDEVMSNMYVYATYEKTLVNVNFDIENVTIEGQESFLWNEKTAYDFIVPLGYELFYYDVIGANYKFNGNRIEIINPSEEITIYLWAKPISNLPILMIDTNNIPILDKENYISGSVHLTNADEYEDVYASMGIRGRGNSTWSMPKKPYRIKFDKRVSLLGMKSAKNYVLLADYADKSLLRNYLAHEMASYLNTSYKLQYEHVVVYLNGEYQGIYLLTEQVQIDENRLWIDDKDQAFDAGFLIELDSRDRAMEEGEENFEYIIVTGKYYVIKSPDMRDFSDLVREAKINYIKSYIRDMEQSFIDGTYENYIDIDSAIDFWIIQELFKNNDAAFSSFYFHKEKNGKIKLGPLWDFDIALGNVNYNGNDNPEGLWVETQNVWLKSLLLYNIEFRVKYYSRFLEIIEFYVPMLLNNMNNEANRIREDAIRNFTKWNILDKYVWPNPDPVVSANTYSKQVRYITDFIIIRTEWLRETLKNKLN
ncbi:CotH kinase family protein [Acholeplasma hippikon]|uniref:Toxin A n=1 Tax=Acholeplasma hippikon TaxID=264636 RepID=A0A449BLG8_9MOLU|nr:CotH kinase family protein [Acholeplasma hippikon]VEU83278.1 Toxin A [Acholeplasma hippikon]